MKEAGSIDVKMHQGMSCNECWARAGVIFFAREAKSRRVVTVFVLPPEKDPELMPPPLHPARPPHNHFNIQNMRESLLCKARQS